MNSNEEPSKPGDEVPSESTIENSSSSDTVERGASGNWCTISSDTMKRAAAKKLIERYFYQLVDGCGDPNCSNEYCASSGKVKNLTPNQAAAQAFQLFSQEAKLCEAHPSKVPRTQGKPATPNNCSESDNEKKVVEKSDEPAASNSNVKLDETQKQTEASKGNVKEKPLPFLTEEKLVEIIKTCQERSLYSLLIRTLGEVYSNPESLSRSFQRTEPESPIEVMLEKAGEKDLKSLKKEDVRALEDDLDKDQDCHELEMEKGKIGENSQSRKTVKRTNSVDITVDILSLRRAYSHLFKLPVKIFEGALVNAIVTLAGNLEIQLKLMGSSNRKKTEDEDLLNIFVIITEIPILGSSEFIDVALPHICKVAAHLSVSCQAKLAKVWARYCKGRLKSLLESLQQLITLKVITASFSRDYCIQDEEAITSPTKLMKILYYANILGGELDLPELRQEEPLLNSSDDNLLGSANKTTRTPPPVDPIESQLQISVLDSRKPLIPFHEFYNEPLSDVVEMDKDFAYYKSDIASSLDFVKAKKFSFMNYSFILTPATKTLGLYYDNRIRMYSERRISFFQTAVGQPTNPFLKLKVRRDHIIDDALVELEVVAMENPKDLKKQLVVEFEGEQGIDEGGVSKEFFQLIVEEIFNPDYGMFVYQQETETVWFNPTSFESDAQFTLIGIVLGLAIYNNIILDVRFPMVVYKKLMGKKGTFYDVQDWNPTLYAGLKELLEYTDDDVEEAFIQTFRVCYTDVFGTTLFQELKEGGDQIFVNQDNKQAMQRRGQIQFRASDKSPIPYARTLSNTPTSFNGRNLDIPKGRLHSPGETLIWKTNKNHQITGIPAPDNYLLPGYKRQGEDENNDFRFTSQTSNSFPADFSSEDIENRSPQNIFKFPVHRMGSLNLSEREQKMNIRDDRAGFGKGTNFKKEIEQKNPRSEAKNNQISEDSQFRRKENLSRILTGPVEKVMNWFKLKNYFHVLFEVIAILVEIKEGSLTGEKCLVLRDERSGPSLFVKYYEMDVKLPPVDIGSVVKCIGRLTSRTHFQAFKVALSSEEERNHSQRLFFISNLVAEEAKTFFMKK